MLIIRVLLKADLVNLTKSHFDDMNLVDKGNTVDVIYVDFLQVFGISIKKLELHKINTANIKWIKIGLLTDLRMQM